MIVGRGRARGRCALLATAVLMVGSAGAGSVQAQGPTRNLPQAVKDLQEARFPQPVRVGAMVGWPVIETGGHYHRLGVVVGVFQPRDGDPQLVMRTTGFFGFGARLVAPPLDVVSLVGPMVKIADLDPKEFADLPTFENKNGAFLGKNEVVRIGVDRKY